MIIMVFGLAGSGKSTLISKMKGKKINLDPGARVLPYIPDINVRDKVRIEHIMEGYGLGPNSAFIQAFSEISENFEINDEPDYVWVDMPGQFEVYYLYDFEFIKGRKVGLYLMDSKRDLEWKNFLMDHLLFMVLFFKFDFPLLRVFSKADLLTEDELDLLTGWCLGEDIPKEEGMLGNILEDLRKLLQDFYIYQRPIFISAYDKESLEELLKFIEESLCTCGDMT